MRPALPIHLPSAQPIQQSVETENASSAQTQALTRIPENGIRAILVGGGPRGVTQVVAEMNFLVEHATDFVRVQQLGGEYKIETVMVERNGADSLGRGNAWGKEQGGGTVNTGAEIAGIDYRPRLEAYFTAKRDKLLAAYYTANPAAASTLRSAFDGSEGPAEKPIMHRAIATRAEQGLEELEHFNRLRNRIADLFPFYKLTVLTKTEATAVDLSNPTKPSVTLVNTRSKGMIGKMQADLVRLNTGTTLASPIRDAEVAKHSFAQAMDPTKLADFLKSKNLLDEQGNLKTGTKLALGGTGLSLFDQIIALHGALPHGIGLLQPDKNSPVGYSVSKEAKERYQGTITIISNTPGKFIPPRHSHGVEWTQPERPLGSPAELHALFLHGSGEEVFKAWRVLLQSSVAVATGHTPGEVMQNGMTTEQLLGSQHQSTMKHVEILQGAKLLASDAAAQKEALNAGAHTLEGIRRTLFLETITGIGPTRDVGETVGTLSELAPHTFKGREGYPIHRAQLKAISEPNGEVTNENAPLMAAFNEYMADITSSPFRVHDMAYMLMEAGIARYMPGSYDSLKASSDERSLSFTGKDGQSAQFDAFIVSPTFNRSAEPVIRSLSGQVKPAHEAIPTLPQVGRNRRLLTKDGTASNVQDFSLNGKGEPIPGSRAKIGAFATDVNNKESATDVAPGLAFQRMALAHLTAAKIPGAARVLDEIYSKSLRPNEEEFNKEVALFKPFFKEAMDRAAFLESVSKAVGDDPAAFKELATRGRAREGRENLLSRYNFSQEQAPGNNATVRRYVNAMRSYSEKRRLLPEFKAPSRDDYYNRFVDVPIHIHEAAYKEALKLAIRHLDPNADLPISPDVTSRELDDTLLL
jgi:hypothetical protein